MPKGRLLPRGGVAEAGLDELGKGVCAVGDGMFCSRVHFAEGQPVAVTRVGK